LKRASFGADPQGHVSENRGNFFARCAIDAAAHGAASKHHSITE
jgi:hypothetical protein